jgi:ABC-type transport system involved in multi-copper enzyme maturation permease subunit
VKNLAQSPFGAIFQAEVLLNTKRVAPYAMALLFGGNALLWWGWGPAAGRGWATNSDFFIAGVLPVYSFMTLPLFTAIIMADPVIRDFRTEVAPLIFSKPVSRAEYLLGKFFGNFFVLVCCQAAFVLTLFVLQAFRRPGMIVQDVRALPYLKHFLVFVVISHLVLAAFYFTVGTLTRNAKIVYSLGVSFYPFYIAYQTVFLRSLPSRWQRVLDPLLMNWGKSERVRSAEWVNQLVVAYDSDLIANRALMILIAAICLAILYIRFAITERSGKVEKFSVLSLSTAAERVYYDSESFQETRGYQFEALGSPQKEMPRIVPLPEVARVNEGIRANVTKLIAALGVEFRLLRVERSLVVIMPLAIFLSILEVAFYEVTPEVSYSAAYATNTAKSLLLFLVGITVFYSAEAMHRDREVRIEPVLWAVPAPNNVFLLSKFLATLFLTGSLVVLVGLIAIVIQFLRGHTPVEVPPFLITYLVILLPGIVFMTGISIALNVLLRDKYLAYAVSIGTGAGLFYLYSTGHNHWLYNPLLYQLWTYADLTGAGSNQATILIQRVYCLAIACACLAFAHLFFPRKSTKGFQVDGRLSGTGWSILIAVVSVAIAAVTGLTVIASVH